MLFSHKSWQQFPVSARAECEYLNGNPLLTREAIRCFSLFRLCLCLMSCCQSKQDGQDGFNCAMWRPFFIPKDFLLDVDTQSV